MSHNNILASDWSILTMAKLMHPGGEYRGRIETPKAGD